MEHQDMVEGTADNASQQLQRRVVRVLELPETAVVEVAERKHEEKQGFSTETKLTIHVNGRHSHEHIIAKRIVEITDEDIESLRVAHYGKPTVLGQLFRFFGWWLGFSGLYAMFAVCPFCGQQGCPVGLGGAGAVGGFFALVVQNGRGFLKFMGRKLFGIE
jgi:hypothetical protein